MPWKRILRDATILSLLCGAFYVSSLVINHIEADETSEDQSFSADRLKADRLEIAENWSAAAVNYQQLIERDPYNGFAWYKLALCHDHLRFRIGQKIDRSLTPDPPSRLQQTILEQYEQHETAAIAAFEKSQEFLRYRPDALRNLATIHAERLEFETSLAYLEQFVNEGNWLIHGLARVGRLGSGGRSMASSGAELSPGVRLHQFPEFWDLVDRERKLREANLPPRIWYRDLGGPNR